MPSILRSIFRGESFHNVCVHIVHFKYLIILFVNYTSKKNFKETTKKEIKEGKKEKREKEREKEKNCQIN